MKELDEIAVDHTTVTKIKGYFQETFTMRTYMLKFNTRVEYMFKNFPVLKKIEFVSIYYKNMCALL